VASVVYRALREEPVSGPMRSGKVTDRNSWSAPRLGRPRQLTLADWVILGGLAAYLVSLVLPAYSSTSPFAGGFVGPTAGWVVAILGGIAAAGAGQPVLLLGWSANLFLVGTLTARRRRRVKPMLVLAVVTEATAVGGTWWLATAEIPLLDLRGLGIGAWVWLAGVTLVLAGTMLYAISQRSNEPRIDAAR